MSASEQKRMAAEIAAEAIKGRPVVTKFANDHLRVMVPLLKYVYSSPISKLATMVEALGVDPNGATYTEVTPENVVQLLVTHTGPEDVPSAESELSFGLNLWDMIKLLLTQKPVYYYEIEWSPNWLRRLRGEFLPKPPDGWLSVPLISELKEISERTVKEYCTKVVDDTTRLDGARCRGGVWYVNPNEKLDYWITKINDKGNLRRRIEMLLDIIETHDPPDMGTMWHILGTAELDMPKYGAYESYPVDRYVERSLRDEDIRIPTSVSEWKSLGPKILMHTYLALEREREQD